MSARAWLEERQALAAAAVPGPWRHWYEAGDIEVTTDDYETVVCASVRPEAGWDGKAYDKTEVTADFITDARTAVPRMVAALTAVLDLHRPMGIYSMEHGDCDHADPESCPPVETDAGTMCGDSPDYYVCEECMDVGGELSLSYPEHPCATVRAIQAALGGEE